MRRAGGATRSGQFVNRTLITADRSVGHCESRIAFDMIVCIRVAVVDLVGLLEESFDLFVIEAVIVAETGFETSAGSRAAR
ncbi:hypothetical protein [Streptomyces celluloflavus]|uniref:hypothetical protein n=1 Tax=Streptomyces celluloflavus TaxID=58344 RepID=UPI0036C540CC